MEMSLNRNEKLIALFALGAMLVFSVMFLQIHKNSAPSVSQIDKGNQINYQMARPEENYSEYNLNGREVDQVYEALKKKEMAQALDKAKPQLVKKAVIANKNSDIKNKGLALNRPQQAAQNSEQAKKRFESQAQYLKTNTVQ